MVTRKETNLSGRYKGPDDVDLLVGCLWIQDIHKGIVEGNKRLTCTSTTIRNEVLFFLKLIKEDLLIRSDRFYLLNEVKINWFLSLHHLVTHTEGNWIGSSSNTCFLFCWHKISRSV